MMTEFGLGEWLVAGIVIYIIYSVASGYTASGKLWVCKACGYVGESESAIRGSIGIEIILWLCFIVPGLIYTIWRRNSEYKACSQCGGDQMIPADSPIGRKIINETTSQEPAARRSSNVTTINCRECGKEHSGGSAACPFCGFKRL